MVTRINNCLVIYSMFKQMKIFIFSVIDQQVFQRLHELFHEKKLSGLCRTFGVVYYVMFKLLVGVLDKLILMVDLDL